MPSPLNNNYAKYDSTCYSVTFALLFQMPPFDWTKKYLGKAHNEVILWITSIVYQGVKLSQIQVPMWLFSFWQPNPENESPNWRLEYFIITLPRDMGRVNLGGSGLGCVVKDHTDHGAWKEQSFKWALREFQKVCYFKTCVCTWVIELCPEWLV